MKQTREEKDRVTLDIKTIMRYATPRMAFRHPLMTLEYLRKKRA